MPPQALFGISVALGFLAWGIVAARYLWPYLPSQPRIDALRPLLVLHSFRFVGLAFLVPGVVAPELSAAFARPAAYGDLIAAILALLALASLQRSLGMPLVWVFNLWGLRFLSGQFRRICTGSIGCRLLHSHRRRAAAADHARTHFPDSPAASKCTCSAGKPAPGMRPAQGCYSCRTGRSTAGGDE